MTGTVGAAVAWFLLSAVGTWLVLRVLRRVREADYADLLPEMPPDDAAPAEVRHWLRHPAHAWRCACGRYGLPGTITSVVDGEAAHEGLRCTPIRERIEE